ncbi:Hypothetical protein D9617_20g027760 [Elsinoe fawcettii]|nr:Hypothetical protein D9617_20g027760 [Elsinoe fawcettii]
MSTSGELRLMLDELQSNEWGWVIYRATYEDDNEWSGFMQRIDAIAQKWLEDGGEPELMASLTWRVEQDPSYQGVTKSQIREHFRELRDKISTKAPGDPRYQYCLFVDQDCLRSVLDAINKPRTVFDNNKGHVILVNGDWTASVTSSVVNNNDERPIEGCSLKDVV